MRWGGVLINIYVHVHTSLTREGWEVGVGKAKDTSAIGVVQSMQGLFVAAAPGFHRKELWKIHLRCNAFQRYTECGKKHAGIHGFSMLICQRPKEFDCCNAVIAKGSSVNGFEFVQGVESEPARAVWISTGT